LEEEEVQIEGTVGVWRFFGLVFGKNTKRGRKADGIRTDSLYTCLIRGWVATHSFNAALFDRIYFLCGRYYFPTFKHKDEVQYMLRRKERTVS